MKELINLVKEAGEIALREQKKIIIQTKMDKSIVTNGDLAVSKFLEERLANLYPDHSIYSEENYKTPFNKKVIVIDPIDGTESYSRNEDTWSILIGFVDGQEMEKGIIYQPTSGLIYFGEKSKGAFVLNHNNLTEMHALGSGEIKAVTQNHITNISHMYSAALKIMKVANGEIDVYPNFRKKCSIWDLVAPMVILKEAGGNVIFEKDLIIDYSSPLVPIDFCALGKRSLSLKF
jgi:3'(2'), 5'-bisphosphate nucleotidase